MDAPAAGRHRTAASTQNQHSAANARLPLGSSSDANAWLPLAWQATRGPTVHGAELRDPRRLLQARAIRQSGHLDEAVAVRSNRQSAAYCRIGDDPEVSKVVALLLWAR